MRKALLTLFWMSNVGNIIQLLIMVTAGWLIFSGDYSFSNLSLEVFVTQVVPWLTWIKSIIATILGGFDVFILSIPVLIISPLKFIGGVLVGWWAYVTARSLPIDSALAH